MSKLYNSTCYCTNLRRSANAMSEFYDSALKEAELTISQYYLLVNLSRLGKANITHWSEQVGLEYQTAPVARSDRRDRRPWKDLRPVGERPARPGYSDGHLAADAGKDGTIPGKRGRRCHPADRQQAAGSEGLNDSKSFVFSP